MHVSLARKIHPPQLLTSVTCKLWDFATAIAHNEYMDSNHVTRAEVGRAIGEFSDAVAAEVANKIYAQLDSYADVPRQAVLGSVRRNLARGVTVLIDGAVPTSIPEQEEAGDTTRERLEQGARWEDIVRAYRLSLTAVHEVFLRQATRSQLDPQATIEGSSLLWDLGDWFTNGSAQALTIWSNEVAGARAAAEAEFVRGLLTDDWQNPRFRMFVEQLGLDSEMRYQVFISHESSSSSWLGAASQRSITAPAEGSQSPIVVSTVLQNRLVGLIRADGTAQASHYPVALGTEVHLDALSHSAHIAESIWPLARVQAPGVYDLAAVSWRVAVPQHPDLSRLFVERYIMPLNPDTEAGRALVSSLKVYLKYDGNVRKTAQELRIHENSLRYRLERFTQKTGVKLDSIDQKIGLAWAIQAYEQPDTHWRFGEFYKNRR